MKATFKSMMVIGMMILGTATAFGKSNFNVDKYNATKAPYTMIVHKNCKIRHKHNKYCGDAFTVRMDKKMEKHFNEGKHKFDKHGMCKKCSLTIYEIRSVEREMRNSRPSPPPAPAHRQHHSHHPHY